MNSPIMWQLPLHILGTTKVLPNTSQLRLVITQEKGPRGGGGGEAGCE